MTLFDNFLADVQKAAQGQGPLAGNPIASNPVVQRFAEHLVATHDRLDGQGQTTAQHLGNLLISPARGALDTAGLGLEGSANVGKALFGEIALAAAKAQVAGADNGVPGFNPQASATQASRDVLQAGPLHPIRALEGFTKGPDSLASWLAGAGALASDPSNYIPGVGEADKAAAQAARLKGAINVAGVGHLAPEAAPLLLGPGGQHLLEAGPSVIHAGPPEAIGIHVPGATPQLPPGPGIAGLLEAGQPIIYGQPPKVSGNLEALREALQGKGPFANTDAPYVPGTNSKWYQRFGYTNGADVAHALATLDAQQGWATATKGIALSPKEKPGAALVDILGQQRTQVEAQIQAIKDTQKPLRVARKGDGAEALAAHKEYQRLDTLRGQLGRQRASLDKRIAESSTAPGLADKQPILSPSKDFNLVNYDGPKTTPLDAPPESALALRPESGVMPYSRAVPVDYTGPTRTPLEAPAPPPQPGGALMVPDMPDTGMTPYGGFTMKPRPEDSVIEGQFRVLGDKPDVPAPNEVPQVGQTGLWGTIRDAGKLAHTAGGEAMRAAADAGNQTVTLSKIYTLWKQQVVNTLRNPLIDYITTTLWGTEAGVTRKALNSTLADLVQRKQQFGGQPEALLSTTARDILDRTGVSQGEDGKRVADMLGHPLRAAEDIAASQFSSAQSAGIEAAFAMLNPAKAAISPLAVPIGAVKGYLRPYINASVTTLTDLVSSAGRVSIFEDEYRQGLQEAARQFADRLGPEALNARGLDFATGAFSAADVQAKLGPQAGRVWGEAVNQALVQASARTKQVFGDYGTQAFRGEDGLKKLIPFVSWAVRAYPRTAAIMADHPGISLAIFHLVMADKVQAELEGRPGYTIGTIPVSTETPLVGKLVGLLTGGEAGTTRINPLAMLGPTGAQGLGTADEIANADTLYGKADAALGAIGFQPRPEIQYGAYLLGQTSQRPGPTSRASGLENAAGAETLPTSQRLLDAGRQAISGQSTPKTDPVFTRAAELVYQRTGLPLTNPRNAKYAADITNKKGIYLEAAAELQRAGLAKNLLSLGTPITSTTSTQTGDAAYAAAGNMPFTYQQLQDAPTPALKTAMTNLNNQYKRANPLAAVHDRPVPPKATASKP